MAAPQRKQPTWWPRLGAVALAALLLVTGCRTRPPTDPVVPPSTPLHDVASVANRLVTSLLIRSPLRDFSRRHTVALAPANEADAATLAGLHAAVTTKLERERHVVLVAATTDADYLLTLRLTPGDTVVLPTVHAELLSAGDRTCRWRFRDALAVTETGGE